MCVTGHKTYTATTFTLLASVSGWSLTFTSVSIREYYTVSCPLSSLSLMLFLLRSSAMSVVLLVIGVVGLSLFASSYFGKPAATDISRIPLHGNILVGREKVNSSMNVCDWNITGFNIQDMVLFAALAYRYIFIHISFHYFALLQAN